jgi:hypothetical protein
MRLIFVEGKYVDKATRIYNKFNPYPIKDFSVNHTDFSKNSRSKARRFVRLNKMFLKALDREKSKGK